MEYMGLNEIREKYLSFFESKGHLRMPSFSLVPKNDPSLLLINSGMAPLKRYFTGQEVPPRKRVTTCQKCIRTPDIERVGKTARHGTFFEMLGNFSFGDYFKKEATAWSWEFLTKVMEIPVDKIWVSIYEEDDEAFEIWTKNVGVSPERIVRLGKEDNFWEHGTGPCGPCSEIYIDRGPEKGCGKPGCAVGCDCDRYVEVWNNVFTQFDRDEAGNYNRLEHPNIDTGMGLERLACVMQGVDNMFEVDTIADIIKEIAKITGVEYGKDNDKDVSVRVITDHIRGTTMMIADGVIPSNEGRGYVLRRLIRRAARHGRLLGLKEPFLYELCNKVIEQSGGAYPELREKQDYIRKLIYNEELSFNQTIDQGLSILASYIDEVKANGGSELSGEQAFKLYDTYGFPLDLTKDIAEEKGISVNEEDFAVMMDAQKKRARDAHNAKNESAWAEDILGKVNTPETVFVGYTENTAEGKVLAIINGDEIVTAASEGDSVTIITDKTPFYGESGGQVGDSGVITNDGFAAEVTDCKKTHDKKFLHIAKVTKGQVAVGDTVTLAIDTDRRKSIMRNHSAAHLLQAALRNTLGTHVEQAGSYVDESRVRFDFTHFASVTADELKAVEDFVNNAILENITNEMKEMPIEEAKKLGAMALFGEKYGDVVRVVKMGDISTEFCGGTHVSNSGKIGLFKIISETSVAAGVRRIEGTTGLNVISLLNEKQNVIDNVAKTFKAGSHEVEAKAKQLDKELKEAQKEIESLNSKLAGSASDDILKSAIEVGGLKIVTAKIKGAAPELRTMGDTIRDKEETAVAVLVGEAGGKATVLVACGKKAVAAGVAAGKVIAKVAEITGGGGGGKPDSAMGSCKDVAKVPEAFEALPEIVKAML
ncbi:MAG: alanine--tRNA ligase [Clostridia bacterium]|nr:alanine--tRNA ligase [Clostridia bacterium]